MVGIENSNTANWRETERAMSATIDDETHLVLLLRYLEICNQVMSANCHRFPYAQIWSAGEDARSGSPVVLLLVDGEVKAACVVTLGKAEIVAEPLPLSDLSDMNGTLPRHAVDMGYVLQVVSTPDLYVADPSKINWDWLKG